MPAPLTNQGGNLECRIMKDRGDGRGGRWVVRRSRARRGRSGGQRQAVCRTTGGQASGAPTTRLERRTARHPGYVLEAVELVKQGKVATLGKLVCGGHADDTLGARIRPDHPRHAYRRAVRQQQARVASRRVRGRSRSARWALSSTVPATSACAPLKVDLFYNGRNRGGSLSAGPGQHGGSAWAISASSSSLRKGSSAVACCSMLRSTGASTGYPIPKVD